MSTTVDKIEQEIQNDSSIVNIETPQDEETVKPERPKQPAFLTTIPTKTSNERSFPTAAEQSIDVNAGTRRRNKYSDALVMRLFEDVQTCYHSFKRAAEKFGDKKCMGVRSKDPKTGEAGPFVYETYAQVYAKIKACAAGLRKLGVNPFEHIGLYSKNRPEWQIVAEACHTQSMVSIALYDTLGEDTSEYIMNHGEIVALFCSGEVISKVINIVPKCKYLKHVVVFDDVSDQNKKAFEAMSPKLMTINELYELGKQNPVEDTVPEADDLTTIMYTSGTTGMPKGVMLSHRNVIAACTGVTLALFAIGPDDAILSYLPLAHIFQRVAEFIFFQNGGSVGYFQGDVKKLVDDMKALRPTVFPAVPRVLDRMYDKIKHGVDALSGLKKYLFDSGFKAKMDAQKRGVQTPIWDYLVFSKFKDGTGGRLRGMLSGGAPLRPEVQEFLRVCFDAPICQGYGLTETTAAGSIQLPFDWKFGSVGCPLPCNEFKLVDVKEMNYLTTNNPPTGEICIRGPNISLGYFKEPKKTAEVFDADGWFHTGDIGRVNQNGTFSIIDRIKNIFKLAHGEYVAAENLEIMLGQSEFVSQIWIYGNSLKASLVAVIVVEQESLKLYASQNGITGDVATLIKDPKIVQAVMERITKRGKEAKIKPYEFPRRIVLFENEFASIDAVTPSMKLKRNVLQQKFQADIDRMYLEIDKDDEIQKKKELEKK